MKLGMVGLGKMGGNMTTRLIQHEHEVVVTDLDDEAIQKAEANGAIGADSLEALVAELDAPRIVWVMVPAGAPTESTLTQLGNLLSDGDIVIDGGNSNYKDTLRQNEMLRDQGVYLVDCGTSGGVWGLEQGYSMMIGGEKDIVEHLRPLFEALAPAADKGWGYVGPTGAGHFVKMIHNGIEYGMMQAFAEGFSILKKKEAFHVDDKEIPLELDLAEVSRIWQDGSVVRSWLLDLIHDAFSRDQEFEDLAAYVPDSGEGRWTVFEAIDLNVAAPVITLALQNRIQSREDGYTEKLLSMMRNQFGGHAMKKQDDNGSD